MDGTALERDIIKKQNPEKWNMADFIQPLQQQQSALSALLTAPRLVMLTMERACKDNTRDTVKLFTFASNLESRCVSMEHNYTNTKCNT
jgi:hypothetical protein